MGEGSKEKHREEQRAYYARRRDDPEFRARRRETALRWRTRNTERIRAFRATMPPPDERSITERRMAPRIIQGNGGCLVWIGARIKTGYGQTRVGNRVHMAHRAYFELRVGPIPEGLELDHLCRNRGCVNPDHLEPVTHKENLLRGTGWPGRARANAS